MNHFLFYPALILLAITQYCMPQSRDDLMNKGIDYIYRIKFDSANAIFQTLINKDPKDPTGYFMQTMAEWWKIFLNKDDESNDQNYLSKVDKCIEVCDARLNQNENDDWAFFLKGGAIGYRGLLNSIRDNWLKAVDDGKEGLSLIQRSYELNPNNKDAIFGVGLYNYGADYVTEAYPFLKTLLFFFPKGNKELGLSQIRDCAENAKFAKTEANVVLCYVNLIYEKNYIESEKYADKLYKQYPENPVFEKYLGRSYVGLGKWDVSIFLWKDVQAKIDSNKAGYNNIPLKIESSYYLGLSYMKSGSPDSAIKYYERTLALSKDYDKEGESPQQVFSALGLGMTYDIKGNRSEAIKYYDMVLNMKDIDSSHDNARQFKENGYK